MISNAKKAFLAFVMAAGVAACGEVPTAPVTGNGGGSGSTATGGSSSVSSGLEVEVAGDSVAAEVAVEDAALSMGLPPLTAGSPFAEAREKFRAAREAFAAGDTALAKELAMEGRILLSQALIDTRGEEVIGQLFGRVEKLIERLDEADDEFDGIVELKAALEGLLAEARDFESQGDLVAAGERLLLALQMTDRARLRHRDFRLNPMAAARLAVARGEAGVELATRMLGDTATQRQLRILTHAAELEGRAQAALAVGAFRRAVVLGWRAEAMSLFAVLGGDRPTAEKARLILDVANTLIEEARAAIGPDATGQQKALLRRAIHLRDMGVRKLQNGQWRGVGLLWHAAVTAKILL
ncbi:MAG: hypothetical protein ACE5HF_06465 [Gemmatimonadota bacterium]